MRIYVKELENGSKAVDFCNFGTNIIDISYSNFDELGINGRFMVRDLWRQKNICTIKTKKDKLVIKVPVHGVLLYKFTPIK